MHNLFLFPLSSYLVSVLPYQYIPVLVLDMTLQGFPWKCIRHLVPIVLISRFILIRNGNCCLRIYLVLVFLSYP